MFAGVGCLYAGPHVQAAAIDNAAPDTGTEIIETVIVTGIRRDLLKDVQKATFTDRDGVEVISGRNGIESFLLRGRDDFNLVINNVLSTPYSGTSFDDVPTEMIKSIKIYHSRSADMAEGGGAGTIEISLKQPLDFTPGFSAAGSATTGAESTRRTASGLWQGAMTWLTAYRADASGDDFGIVFSGKYSHGNSFTLKSQNGVPVAAADQYGSLPAAIATTTTFNSVSYNQSSEQNSNLNLSLVAQWRHGNVNITVDGSATAGRRDDLSDSLRVYTSDSLATVTKYTTSNSGNTSGNNTDSFLSSATTITAAGTVNGGPETALGKNRTETQKLSIMPSWHNEALYISAYSYLLHTHMLGQSLSTEMRFADSNMVTTNFTPTDRNTNGPEILFSDTSLQNPDAYRISSFGDTYIENNNTFYAGSLSAWYSFSEIPVLKGISAGYSSTYRHSYSRYNYRYAIPYQDTAHTSYLSVTSLGPCSGQYDLIRHGSIRDIKWYTPAMHCIAAHYSGVADFIAAGVAEGSFVSSDDWTSTDHKNSNNLSQFTSTDNNQAVFIQAEYGLIAPIPLSGQLGLRAVYETATFHRVGATDSSGDSNGQDGYVNYIPNASFNANITDKITARLDYSFNTVPPSSQMYHGTGSIDKTSKVIYKGYSRLNPQTEQDYNAALTYRDGETQTFALKYFRNRIHGKPYNSGIIDTDPSSSTYGYTIYATRNAGHGGYEGVEFSLLQMMDVLPDHWKNLGINASLDWMIHYRMTYPYGEKYIASAYQAEMASRTSGKIGIFYDSTTIGATIMYRFKGRYRLFTYDTNPVYSPYCGYSSSLNAQLNYYYGQHIVVRMKGSNLLGAANRSTWGIDGPFRGIDLTQRKIELTLSVM